MNFQSPNSASAEDQASRDTSSPANATGPITRFCIAASAVIKAFKASEAAARCAPTIAAAKAKCAEAVAEAKAKCKEEVATPIKAKYAALIAEAKRKGDDEAIAEASKNRAAEISPITARCDVVTKDAERTCAEAVAEAQANCPDWKAAKAKYDADIDQVMVQADASQGLDAALDQIEGMRGSADVPVRLKVLKPGTDEKDETTGTIEELDPQCQELGENGCNMYVFLQPIECAGKYANGTHVTHIEVIAADGDTAPLPTKFHVEPSFMLFNRDTFRWWLYWRIEGLDKEDFTPMQKRLIAEYDSDPAVHDRVRVGRLAGGPRWKDGKRYGEYEYIHGTGATTRPEDHEGLPQVATAKEKSKTAKSDEASTSARREVPLSEWTIKPDQPRNIERAIKYASTCEVGTKLVDGDDTLYKTAGMMKDYGLSRPKAMEVLEAEYLPRCLPTPWHPDQVFKKTVASAYRSTLNEPGCKTSEYESKEYEWNKSKAANDDGQPGAADNAADGGAAEAATGDDDDDLPYLVNGPDLAKQPQIEWIFKGIQAKGDYAIGSGGSGAGKTTAEIARLFSIITGKPWLGMLPEVNGGSVLKIESEGQNRSWNDMCALCDEHGIEPECLRDKWFTYTSAIQLNTTEGERLLMKVLERIKRITGSYPVEVLVDTLRGNMTGSVSDEKDAEGVMDVAKRLKKLGIAVTLIAHHGRATGETKGLTDWGDLADATRYYTGEMEKGTTKIEFRKVRHGESRWSMDVRYELRQLKSGQNAMVLVSGKRVGDTSALFKDGADTQDKPATDTGRKRNKNDKYRNLGPVYQQTTDAAIWDIIRGVPAGKWSALAIGNALIKTGEFPNMTGEGLSKGIVKTLTNIPGTHTHRCATIRPATPLYYQMTAEPPFYKHSDIWVAQPKGESWQTHN